MNLKNIGNISVLSGLAAPFGAAFLALTSVPAAAESAHYGLTGTWEVTVQQYDCISDALLGPSFRSFLTFGSDQTLVETTANPAFAPGQRGPGHGFWARTGPSTYRAVSEAFIVFATPAHGPVPPFGTGTQRIEQHVDYGGGEQFTSVATVTFTDPSGTVLASGCASAGAVRVDQ